MCLRFTCFEEHCCKNVAAALAKVGPNRPKLANAGFGQPRLAKIHVAFIYDINQRNERAIVHESNGNARPYDERAEEGVNCSTL